MRVGILGALAGLAALTSLPASAGYFPSIYESRYDYGSTYVDTFVDGVGAGVVVHERSYVGLNNPDPSIRYKTALDGCLYGLPRGCDRSVLTIDDRARVAAARGPAPLSWTPTTYVPYAVVNEPVRTVAVAPRPRARGFVYRRTVEHATRISRSTSVTVERTGVPFRRYVTRSAWREYR
ncbi:hypothetical protein [Methylobacterium radiotolerans]|uniref:hypothetical protein n=1 Tax=Methylobacterium radiotolerans TaxID=31998 RepID=UPI0038CF5EC9